MDCTVTSNSLIGNNNGIPKCAGGYEDGLEVGDALDLTYELKVHSEKPSSVYFFVGLINEDYGVGLYFQSDDAFKWIDHGVILTQRSLFNRATIAKN